MSCSTDIVYGYGFEVANLDKDLFAEFLKNHKNTLCKEDCYKSYYDSFEKLSEDDFEMEDLEEVFEGFSCAASGSNGLGAVVSSIMYLETGIRFEYQPGQAECDGEASVLFSEAYPWNLNEVEKGLTQDAMQEVLKKYMAELGILSNENLPDFLRVEYFG